MTTYNHYLSLLMASCQRACEYIPSMCRALKEENPQYSNRDIRVRVRNDCKAAGLASSTITHNIPQEFKNQDKVNAGKKGAKEKKKKNKTQEQESKSDVAENIEIGYKKDEGSLDLQRIDDSAEKKKILLQITTSGAAESAAENSPESEKKPDLRILENSWRKDACIDDSEEEMSKHKDIEFLKKQLGTEIEENRQKDIQIRQLQNEKMQLSEVIKQYSFTQAKNYKPAPPKEFNFPEPDECNTFVWKRITFDEFRMELGPLKARANTKINVYLERVV